MEEQLLHLDNDDSERCPEALQSREIDEERDKSLSRKKLFEKMHQKLRDYGNCPSKSIESFSILSIRR